MYQRALWVIVFIVFTVTIQIFVTLSVLGKERKILFKSNISKKVFYRIPALVVIDKSKIMVAFAERRNQNQNKDSGNIDVVYKFSKNHGKSWSKEYTLCNMGSDTCGNPTAVVDQRTQRVHVFMNWNSRKMDRDNLKAGDRLVYYSSGVYKNGKFKFKKPKNMTKTLQKKSMKWDAAGPGVGIQVRYGKHKGRLIIPAIQRSFYSDNGGRTWKMSKYSDTKSHSSEAAVVELGDGTLYRNARPTPRSSSNENYYRMTQFSFTQSINGFGQLKKDYKLVDPRCQGSLLNYNKDIVLHANCNTKSRPRKNLTIRATKDGKKWLDKFVADTKCGYSSMAKTRDANMGILYESRTSSSFPRGTSTPLNLIFAKYNLKNMFDDPSVVGRKPKAKPKKPAPKPRAPSSSSGSCEAKTVSWDSCSGSLASAKVGKVVTVYSNSGSYEGSAKFKCEASGWKLKSVRSCDDFSN